MLKKIMYVSVMLISMLSAATVNTDRNSYTANQPVVVSFGEMEAMNSDWIAIYPVNSTNDWGNQVQWKWTNDLAAGDLNFEPLPQGVYEVRVFYNDSFVLEASKQITVNANANVTTLNTDKETYLAAEKIVANFNNMSGNDGDWIGIYAAGSENTWANMLQWSWVETVNGTHTFDAMPVGNYEVRVFFNNSFHSEAVSAFTVEDNRPPVERVVYDDFENGVIDPRWVRFSGPDMTISNRGVSAEEVANKERKVIVGGGHSLLLKADYRGGLNHAGYYFNFNNPDSRLKFLEIDISMNGVSHSAAFGVKVKTKFGDRRIEFASWLNHTLPSGQQIYRGPYGNVLPGHRQAFTTDNYLYIHPGPSDYTVGSRAAGGGQNMFVHFKIDIEEKLKLMEPDNELLGITLFISSGGYYDNLALSPE